MKLCKDCKWIDHRLLYVLPEERRCHHPELDTGEISLIDGEPIYEPITCTELRSTDVGCGEEAKWYEPKAYLLHIEHLDQTVKVGLVRARPPSIPMRGRSYKTNMDDLV